MKFKKNFRKRHIHNCQLNYSSICFGSYGLRALDDFNLTTTQLSSIVRIVKRIVRKKNFLIIRAIPYLELTRKPRDVRMGRGKGNPLLKVCPVRRGDILFEVRSGFAINKILYAFKQASLKLPVNSIILKKNGSNTEYISSS
jgi:large subunit ribosomal protein L16